ncbi:hypothetical protein K438DRAFT_2017099 [Mycena galopus ATCC 62051]|nr:hypothetical protein K438DRAFT_2017099 [Mycena galopus ATCC 62051]
MSRSRRSKSQVSAAAEGVSVLDKLVLAQAVWEVGTSSWLKISRILGKHALLTHPKTFFTAQSCHAMYNHMMKESGFELSEAKDIAHAPIHFKLAEKYYAERVEELRSLISAEEQQFKAIVAEIDQIRAGQKDEEIKARITGISAPEKEPEDPVEESGDISPGQDVPADDLADMVSAAPKDETPEIEVPVADSETMEPDEPVADIPVDAVPPTPEVAMEDIVLEQDGTKVSAEPTPTPEAPLSPPENLDHLMQISDDEQLQDPEGPDPVPEEPAVDMPEAETLEEVVAPAEETVAPVEETAAPAEETAAPAEEKAEETAAPIEDTAEETVAPAEEIVVPVEETFVPMEETVVPVEETVVPMEETVVPVEETVVPVEETIVPVEETVVPMEETVAPAEEIVAAADDSEPAADDIKPEPIDTPNDEADIIQSQSKPASKASESGLAEEEGVSTRRSIRRRPSISTVSTPAAGKKRGRRAKTPELEAEMEPQSIPAPAAKEETPALDEAQPDEEMPMSAAARRRDGKRKASFFGSVDSPRASKRAREESEPVDEDEQPSTPAALRRRATGGRTEEQVALKRFQTVITMVHSQISQHRNGNIFHNPIKVSEAPDYHDIVKRPIDLKTIKAKIKDGVIGNSLEYQRDIYLMFANAMMYNRPGSDVHVMAEDMMVESDGHINTFRQTEGYVKSR